MDCKKVQEQMLDHMGAPSAPADLAAHMAGCAECTRLWQALQVSSAALDEFTVPQPSPYFNTRFQARLAGLKRDEATRSAGVFGWLRNPFSTLRSRASVAAVAAALAVAVAVGVYERPSSGPQNNNVASQVSPAVNDLQKLDKDEDLYADFEMLDDLQTDNSRPAQSTTDSSVKSEL